MVLYVSSALLVERPHHTTRRHLPKCPQAPSELPPLRLHAYASPYGLGACEFLQRPRLMPVDLVDAGFDMFQWRLAWLGHLQHTTKCWYICTFSRCNMLTLAFWLLQVENDETLLDVHICMHQELVTIRHCLRCGFPLESTRPKAHPSGSAMNKLFSLTNCTSSGSFHPALPLGHSKAMCPPSDRTCLAHRM